MPGTLGETDAPEKLGGSGEHGTLGATSVSRESARPRQPDKSRASITHDWDHLHERARTELDKAYAPYSKFRVAAVASNGSEIFTGVNIENASYGVTMCAENTLIAGWVMAQTSPATKLLCTSEQGLITPCGRCRQLLMEHFGPELKILTSQGETTLGQLLPEAFHL